MKLNLGFRVAAAGLVLVTTAVLAGADNSSTAAQKAHMESLANGGGECARSQATRCKAFNMQAARSSLLVRQLMAK
jgi:hypothetical protein